MTERTIHICFSQFDKQEVKTMHCPTCGGEQQFLCQHQEWYGWLLVCLACGEQWSDGEMCERPFMRGWRKKNVDHYRAVAVKLGLLEAVNDHPTA